jgi:hypothetical protein
MNPRLSMPGYEPCSNESNSIAILISGIIDHKSKADQREISARRTKAVHRFVAIMDGSVISAEFSKIYRAARRNARLPEAWRANHASPVPETLEPPPTFLTNNHLRMLSLPSPSIHSIYIHNPQLRAQPPVSRLSIV